MAYTGTPICDDVWGWEKQHWAYHITPFWGWFLQDECPMVLIISHAKSHACAGAGDLCTGYAVKNGGKNKVIK
jgi:hypothetical protein